MVLHGENNLEKVYEVLDDKLSKTKIYKDYVLSLINNEKVSKSIYKSVPNIDDELNHKIILQVFSDVKYVKILSSLLGMENEFSKMILCAAKSENIFSSIINTKFVETIYGNPNKDDLSTNDALFTILESVFGLDTIIESITNENALMERFDLIMGQSDPNLASEFSVLINNLYKLIKDEKDYNNVKLHIQRNSYDLRAFILAGLNKQNDEITKDPNGSFIKYNLLYSNVLDVIGKVDSKKM